jgi:hypothetical protein
MASPASVDPKEKKRQKQAAFEKKNWLAVNDDKEREEREADEAFGIRLEEDFEKDDAEMDWFSPQWEDPSGKSGPQISFSRAGQPRAGAGPNRAGQNRVVDSKESAAIGRSSATDGFGSRLAPDPTKRSLLSGAAGDSLGANSSFSFKNLFGGAAAAEDNRGNRSPLGGLGPSATRGSMLGFENAPAPQPVFFAPASSSSSLGFSDNSLRSQNGLLGDRSSWSGIGQPGAPSDYLLQGSDSSGSSVTPQQPLNQRRSFRDFDKPKFPGQ